MMGNISINDFTQEINCTYKEEIYAVRDNGAVLRYSRSAGRKRPIDDQWTFGKPNEKYGYMEIASRRVHSIVATAFHGEPPTKDHVVDHIDTNKRNNRPENLRWLTRLENIVLNEITAKRIALVCGSVEAFLADPPKFKGMFPDPNYEWMCTVGKEDAQASLARLLSWAQSDKIPSGGTLGEWIYRRSLPVYDEYIQEKQEDIVVPSKTSNAVQRNWKVPSEFPNCPQEYADKPLIAYLTRLTEGAVFCLNDRYSSVAVKSVVSDDGQSLFVLSGNGDSENAIKGWALATVTYENGLFVHTSIQTFFSREGAEKQYCLIQGHEWTGEDSIDDYC